MLLLFSLLWLLWFVAHLWNWLIFETLKASYTFKHQYVKHHVTTFISRHAVQLIYNYIQGLSFRKILIVPKKYYLLLFFQVQVFGFNLRCNILCSILGGTWSSNQYRDYYNCYFHICMIYYCYYIITVSTSLYFLMKL